MAHYFVSVHVKVNQIDTHDDTRGDVPAKRFPL